MKKISIMIAGTVFILAGMMLSAGEQGKAMTRTECLNKYASEYNMKRLECQKQANAKCKKDNKCYQSEYKACDKKITQERIAGEKTCPKR